MNARQLSWVLLLLNLGLLGVVVFLVARQPGNGSADGGSNVEERIVTNTVTQIAVRKINATNLLAALANRPLSWRMLESTNYFAYAQNLRNFGCPEETVRDILLTDVARFYGERRRELRARAPLPDFWRPSPHADGKPGESPELTRQLAELNHEEDGLIRDLLGVDREVEMSHYSRDPGDAGPLVSFLPEAKRAGVTTLQARYAALEQGVYDRAGGLLLDTDREALRTLQKQRDAELAQLLTPDELLTYQLYNSGTANQLRTELTAFGATQDEFLRIFQLRKSFDDQFGGPGSTPGSRQAKSELEAAQALEESLRRSLGPQRFGEYQRSQDGDYRALLQMAGRYQLAPAVANNVYAMKMTAERQKFQVESTPNLTDVQRAQALARLAEETERSVAGVLGGSIYKDYQNGPGQWLNNLYFFNEDNLPPEPEPPSPPEQAQTRHKPILPPLPAAILNSLPPGYRELILETQGGRPPGPPPPGAPNR